MKIFQPGPLPIFLFRRGQRMRVKKEKKKTGKRKKKRIIISQERTLPPQWLRS